MKKTKSLYGIGAKRHRHFKDLKKAEKYLSKKLNIPVEYEDVDGMTPEVINAVNDMILTMNDIFDLKPIEILSSSRWYEYRDYNYGGVGTSEEWYGYLVLSNLDCEYHKHELNAIKYKEKMYEQLVYRLKNGKSFSVRDLIRMRDDIAKEKIYEEDIEDVLTQLQENAKYKCSNIGVDAKTDYDFICRIIAHEFGHLMYGYAALNDYCDIKPINENIKLSYDEALKIKDDGLKDIYQISRNSARNTLEFFAECFSMYIHGLDMPQYCKDMVEAVIHEYKKCKEIRASIVT